MTNLRLFIIKLNTETQDCIAHFKKSYKKNNYFK